MFDDQETYTLKTTKSLLVDPVDGWITKRIERIEQTLHAKNDKELFEKVAVLLAEDGEFVSLVKYGK